MKKIFNKIEPEHIVGFVMMSIIIIVIVSLFLIAPKCATCGEFVQTAYCTRCGASNENYKEPVIENKTGLTCPECNIECLTKYCGDCGSEVVFVEPVDAVTGG